MRTWRRTWAPLRRSPVLLQPPATWSQRRQSGRRRAFLLAAAQAPAPMQPQSAPAVITLQDAIARARATNPEFILAARTELGVAREDRYQARAALLPSVNYNNQYIYTQGGTGSDIP